MEADIRRGQALALAAQEIRKASSLIGGQGHGGSRYTRINTELVPVSERRDPDGIEGVEMSQTQHAFVAETYAPRAADYVTSVVHAAGADLDQVEGLVRGAKDARVLDLGCGGGHVSYKAAPHVREVVACDLTADMLAQVAREAEARGLANIVTRQAPAEALPFDTGEFDIVLCRFTVHHWNDAEAGLREARRVLKPGGRAVFIDVVAPAHPLLDTHLQTIELLRDLSHVRDYTVAEWMAALSRSGFAATGLTPRRLRMDFPTWCARTRTAPVYEGALRALQGAASAPVRAHFEIEPDGSFMLDTVTIEARPA
jgi:ubiquinone/menaquinone biosynthesis C-methylase UbiE